MATELFKKIGDTTSDDLFAGITPPARTDGRTVRAQSSGTVALKRGTLMAVSSTDGKLVPLGSTAASGETLTPDSVLCDEVIVGTADVNTAVYASGCFNENRIITAGEHTITAAEKDTLRKYDIILKAVETM